MANVSELLRQQASAIRGIPALDTSPADAGCVAGQYIERAMGLGAFEGGPRDSWIPMIRERLSYAKGAKGPDPHLSVFAEAVSLAWRMNPDGSAHSPAITSPEAFALVADAIDSEASRLEPIAYPVMRKPDRLSNPLLTDPAVSPDLKPLFDALVMVTVWSDALAECYFDLLAERESRGMPKADEWPDSPALELTRARYAELAKAELDAYEKRGERVSVGEFLEPRWTGLIREWSGYYQKWSDAIATAKQAVASPAVAAIMDAGELRPLCRWTTRATIELDNLVGKLHPITLGVDGCGVLRSGLPPLPTDFRACADAVQSRLVELRSIHATDTAPLAASVSPELLEGLEAGIAARVVKQIGSLSAPEVENEQPVELPELHAQDTEAWQASLVPGMTQAKIAHELNRRYPGKNWTQPRVSEAIKRAKAHVEASGLADKISATRSRVPARTLDPGAADLGQRTDGRTKHLREKAWQIAKEE